MRQERLVEVTDDSFAGEVLESEIPVLVDYWAPWCGPCKMAAPVLERIAGQYEGRLKVCQINVDEHREAASRQQIMSIPTMFLFKDGEVVDQIMGVTPNFEADLKKRIEPHLG